MIELDEIIYIYSINFKVILPQKGIPCPLTATLVRSTDKAVEGFFLLFLSELLLQ